MGRGIMMSDEGRILQCLIMLTRNCNLRCNFCFEKNSGYSAEHRIDYANLKKIVDFCSEAKVKYIVFSGGEPLLYPQLVDILQYIKSNHPSITATIATNGVLLEDPALCKRLVDSGIKYIDLSMKGSDSQEWCQVTGYDGSAQQQQAIRNLSTLPVEFSCSMVVTPENVSTLCDAVQVAYDNGARQFSFTFVIDNEDAEEKDRMYLLNHNPFMLINGFLSQVDRLNTITHEWWIEYSFPMCVYTEEQLIFLKGKLAEPCYVHMRNAVIFDTDMNLLPCDMYTEQKMGRFGVDFSSYQEFEELSGRPSYQDMMDVLDKLPSSECASCPYLESCYGGCQKKKKNYSFEALKAFKKESELPHQINPHL